MTSDSKRSGNTAGPATLLGAPSVLIIRLRGDVFPIEITRNVIERNKNLDILTQFVVPQSPAFIPPVGKKFFDPAYIESQKALHSRGKVNISLIKGRDAELRSISEVIADTLFKSLLTGTSVKEYCRSTLSGVNQYALDMPQSSYGLTSLPGNDLSSNNSSSSSSNTTNPSADAILAATKRLSDNISYGVYFREIQPVAPLVERLVTELKHTGVLAAIEGIDPFTGTPKVSQAVPGALQIDDATGQYVNTSTVIADAATDATQGAVGASVTVTVSATTAAEVVEVVPCPWKTAGDAVLAARADEVSFNFKHTARVFAALGITSTSADVECRVAFEDIMQW